ncbi:MAG TPA: VTT domain-containing protein [Longimicrobium sp.]|nr:VTT domain-containing protein [Longimicrobium sp.]
MRRCLVVFLLVCAAPLVMFAAASALGVSVLDDPSSLPDGGGAATALVTTGLLVADVLIPVPSSLLMIANGAFFGVAGGTALSLAGGVGAAALGWALGRRGTRAAERFVPAGERVRAIALVERWGVLAVIASRPVPILAEAVAIAAGLAGMRFGRLVGSSLAGSVPAAFLYALTGAHAARLDSAPLVFGLVLAAAAAAWWIGSRAGARRARRHDADGELTEDLR